MNRIFNALSKEAQFTKEMLGSGATQIRECNYGQKGTYFQAFTSLSTGLERIGKLCLMLDFYIENNGQFPKDAHMKKEIGHNINKLFAKSVEISQRRSISFTYPFDPHSKIYINILSVLSAFAMGDRYSNIDLLLGSSKPSDPLSSWYNTVDCIIFDKYVSARKKRQIVQNSEVINRLLGEFSTVSHTSETGSEINNIEEASYRAGMQEAVALYRQLFIIQIIRFWVEILGDLQYSAMQLGNEEIPMLSEVFGLFYNTDKYIKTRKTWDKL